MNTEQKMTEALNGLVNIQQHLVGMRQPGESLGERVCKSAQDFISGKADNCRIQLTPMEFKTAITATGAANDPLTNTLYPQVAESARRRLFLRDLLTSAPTQEAAIEYPRETGSTNNAGSQDGQNTSFNESAFTFDLSFQPVQTIGHFIPVSKNVLQDSHVLDVFLRNSLLYGLRLKEEDQILNADGTNGTLNGILNSGNFTDFNRAQSPADTPRDTVGRALTQVELADYSPDGIVLNPEDWETIKLSLKTEAGYLLWGVPVAVTNAIASGTFLVGDFKRGASLFDRKQASINISNHDDTNFRTGMVTMLASERVGLVVSNPGALVSGSF